MIITPTARPRVRASWTVPTALLVLSAFPVMAGTLRLVEVVGGPHLLPDNPRIDAFPAPVVAHIIAAALYALAGAFQFSAGLRRRWPAWHRTSGRLLVGAGLVVALSGLWMTLFYADAPGGAVLWTVRLVVGSVMAGSILLGVTAVRRGDIAAHRAWMIRGYALGLGAGTQVLTQGIGEGLLGTSDLSTALSLSSGWVINAAGAEWGIRRPAGSGRHGGRPRAAHGARAGTELVDAG